jgi:thiol:disulfide interchange protein DsbD
MGALLERITEWQQTLGQSLGGSLESGSPMALLIAFASGLLTSFTPCVYPMIPVTVAYMGGAASGSRRRAFTLSLIYVLGLALVYAALGVVVALLGKTFGQFTRNPFIYGAVGAVIAVFGLAMLDLFTIPVPGFAGRVQSEGVRRGGYLGALMMGGAAGFVAAPCTAPVLLVLLTHVARTRDVVWGGTLTLVFALGLSALLLVVGIFSGLLSNLPRPGVWMDRLKKAFGILMLLVAGWFLFQTIHMLIYPSGGGV